MHFQQALNTNALAIPSSSEGGILGHLALVIPEDQYTNVSEGVVLSHQPGLKQIQRTKLEPRELKSLKPMIVTSDWPRTSSRTF